MPPTSSSESPLPLPPAPGPPSAPGPTVPPAPDRPVEGSRRRWRRAGTAVLVAGGLAAVVALVVQVSVADVAEALRAAGARWFAVVLAGSLLTFVGATTTIMAVSPVRLRVVPSAATQVAGTFVNLLGPAGLGGMALNARYLTQRGATVAAAVAAVLAVQVTSVVVTVLLLLVAVVSSGRTAEGIRLLPDAVTIVTVVAVVVALLVVAAVRPVRRRILRRVRRPLRGVVDAFRALLRRPDRLLRAFLGASMVTGGFLLALWASLQAYGVGIPLLELAVVLFAGTAVGSVFPTPGGVGAVEAAVAGGLVAVGVPPEPAVLAAVTYRVATLWLWVLPGWLLALLLRRSGDL